MLIRGFKVLRPDLTPLSVVSKCIIYALRDPRSDEYRYIGQSSRGINRPVEHTKKAYKKTATSNYCYNWIRSLHNSNCDYEIVILEEVAANENLDRRETWWIEWYRNGHCRGRLTNVSGGGFYEDRSVARAALKALYENDPAFKKRVSDKAKLYWASLTPEERKNHSKLTDEERKEVGKRFKKFWEKLTPAEQKQYENKRRTANAVFWATKTSEERVAIARQGIDARTPEQRSDSVKKAWATRRARLAELTPEAQKEYSNKMGRACSAGWAAKSAEERSMIARKGVARRARRLPRLRINLLSQEARS